MTLLDQFLDEPQLQPTPSPPAPPSTVGVVVAALVVLAVGVILAGRDAKRYTPGANTEPYVVLDGAAFPDETFTVTAFRKDGQDCVEATSAITGGSCNPGQYDAVAQGSQPALLAAVAMMDRTQLLWFGAVSPDLDEVVVELQTGEQKTYKPVPPQTAGTSLPAFALYLPDQRQVASITGRRTDGTTVSAQELLGGPHERDNCLRTDTAGQCLEYGSTAPPTR